MKQILIALVLLASLQSCEAQQAMGDTIYYEDIGTDSLWRRHAEVIFQGVKYAETVSPELDSALYYDALLLDLDNLSADKELSALGSVRSPSRLVLIDSLKSELETVSGTTYFDYVRDESVAYYEDDSLALFHADTLHSEWTYDTLTRFISGVDTMIIETNAAGMIYVETGPFAGDAKDLFTPKFLVAIEPTVYLSKDYLWTIHQFER